MDKSHMIGLMALALASVLSPATIAAEVRDITSANVYFSPEESGLKVLCSQIDAAQTHIRVAAFHFAETPMLDALIRAHQRGVKVEVVLDHEHIEYRPKKAAPNVKDGPSPVLARLMKVGIPAYVDTQHKTMHNKYMVIDSKIVTTGSYNFNKKAESKNAENLLVLHSVALAKAYDDNWALHKSHSVRY